MAARFRVCRHPSSCCQVLVYILVFTLTNSLENATFLPSNVTLLSGWNVTNNATDDFTLNESTSTQASEYNSTEQPALSPGPLPLSGRLPPPAVNVGGVCPCDERRDVCDSNCCCDTVCGDQVALFTSCLVSSVGGNKQLCSRDVASYSLGSTADGYSLLQASVRRERNTDVFCIHSQNGMDGFSHPPPALPTDANFDSLFQQSTTFMFSPEVNSGQVATSEVPTSSGYQKKFSVATVRYSGSCVVLAFQYGDVIVTLKESGERGQLPFPAPGLSAHCVDSNPAAFLMDLSSRCTRDVLLARDCSTLPALNIHSFTNLRVVAGKNDNASVVAVEMASVVLQSVEGTQTELQTTAGKHLQPVLLNSSLCANVVFKVAYVMTYSPAGEILGVALSVVLGFLQESQLPLQQDFQTAFVQDEFTVRYSGNPGYVIGLPLVSGTRTADGMARSVNPRDTLSVLRSTEKQDCLRGPHQRSPILFGVDFVSGCTLKLKEDANCSLVSQTMLSVLRGSNPEYVASFGNSPLEYPLDWLPIRSNFNPAETQSCSIPVSYHLEIKWTKYGSLRNPQAQLVSIEEVIQTNKSSLASLSGGNSVLPIRSSAAFVAISAAAAPGYRAMPTINAKLPADFFFPFV